MFFTNEHFIALHILYRLSSKWKSTQLHESTVIYFSDSSSVEIFMLSQNYFLINVTMAT